jgi:hypothetical protein
MPLLAAPYDAAGNGRNGTGSAGRALRRGKLRQCEKSHSGARGIGCFRLHLALLFEIVPAREIGLMLFEPGAFVYAKSAGLAASLRL